MISSYVNTSPGSKLRMLLVDLLYLRSSDEEVRVNLCSAQRPGFILDYLRKHYEHSNVNEFRRQPYRFGSSPKLVQVLYHE